MDGNNYDFSKYLYTGYLPLAPNMPIMPQGNTTATANTPLDSSTPRTLPAMGGLGTPPSLQQSSFGVSTEPAKLQDYLPSRSPRTPMQTIYHSYRTDEMLRTSPPIRSVNFNLHTYAHPSRFAVTPGYEPVAKKYKRTHNGTFTPTLDEQIEATALYRPSDQSNPFLTSATHSRYFVPKDLSKEPMVKHEQASSEAMSDNETEIKDPRMITADTGMFPPAWIQSRLGKHIPQASQTQYPLSSKKWQSEDSLQEHMKSLIVKPKPPHGDRGIPKTKEEETALAKKVYDAIIDTGHFYGSTTGAVQRLLIGDFDQVYIQRRSVDIVRELKEYHTHGITITDYADPNITSRTGALVKFSERDDTCEERVKNILDSLRFCKSVAADVLMAKESLATVLLLAPKARMKAKLAYKESNDGRGVNHKKLKEKASAFDAQEQAQGGQ